MVHSIHSHTVVNSKCILSIFNKDTDFFILPHLETFDAIIGLDTLNDIGAKIDFKKGKINYENGNENLKYFKCKSVNFINIDDVEVPTDVKERFNIIIKKRMNVFADPNESLPFNTNIVATIRTTSDDPIYSKLYPYPMGVADFVNKEIKDLLANNIIRPSRSPYNNPLWVVDKKGVDEEGNRKKRLVTDFRKLNKVTIDDKYPIPSIAMILANMGKAKYFTTLDLKSGFHQIELSEKDREKRFFGK